MTDPYEEPTADDLVLDHELGEMDPMLAGQLRELLNPGDLVSQRTAVDVDRALRAQSPMGAVADLVGTGWQTLRLLLTDDQGPADRDGEGS